jgi:hypothetical protein
VGQGTPPIGPATEPRRLRLTQLADPYARPVTTGITNPTGISPERRSGRTDTFVTRRGCWWGLFQVRARHPATGGPVGGVRGLGPKLRRLTMAAVSGLVVFGAVSTVIPSAASAASARSSAPARVSKPALPRKVRLTATPSSVPGAPFIEEVIPEGLSVLVNWDPNPASEDVTGYKLAPTRSRRSAPNPRPSRPREPTPRPSSRSSVPAFLT